VGGFAYGAINIYGAVPIDTHKERKGALCRGGLQKAFQKYVGGVDIAYAAIKKFAHLFVKCANLSAGACPLAAELGLEPRLNESESFVLPLHNSANSHIQINM
jgi:hypothetical protein